MNPLVDRCCSRARTPPAGPPSSSVSQTLTMPSATSLEMAMLKADAKPQPPCASAPAASSIPVTAPRFLPSQHEAAARRQGAQSPNFSPGAARGPAACHHGRRPSGRAAARAKKSEWRGGPATLPDARCSLPEPADFGAVVPGLCARTGAVWRLFACASVVIMT